MRDGQAGNVRRRHGECFCFVRKCAVCLRRILRDVVLKKSEANVSFCCGNLDISTNDDALMRYLNYEMITGIG